MAFSARPVAGSSLSVSLAGVQSDADLRYEWRLGGGSGGETELAGSGPTAVLGADAGGKYLSCIATDASGKYTGSVTGSAGLVAKGVLTGTPGFGAITGSTVIDGVTYRTGKVGLEATGFLFSAPDGAVLSYEWVRGDLHGPHYGETVATSQTIEITPEMGTGAYYCLVSDSSGLYAGSLASECLLVQ